MISNDDTPASIEVWTDGACSGNPGPGGWAYVVRYGNRMRSSSGSVAAVTTNSAMEMVAAIQALRSLKRTDLPATVFTDSQFIAKGMTEWLPGWVSRSWRKADGRPVENQPLWEELKRLSDARLPKAQISFQWIKGHAGQPENEQADGLAQAACRRAATVAGSTKMPSQYDPARGLVVSLFTDVASPSLPASHLRARWPDDAQDQKPILQAAADDLVAASPTLASACVSYRQLPGSCVFKAFSATGVPVHGSERTPAELLLIHQRRAAQPVSQ